MEEVRNKKEMVKSVIRLVGSRSTQSGRGKTFHCMLGCCFVLLLVAFAGCKKGMGDVYSDYFENDKAAKFDFLIEMYDDYEEAYEKGTEDDIFELFYGKYAKKNHCEVHVLCDTFYVIRLPEYASSSHPFLSRAESYFNACLLSYNVWSNYELLRAVCEDDNYSTLPKQVDVKDIVEGHDFMGVERIADAELREDAQAFKDCVAAEMKRTLDGYYDDYDAQVISTGPLELYGKQIFNKQYMYYTDEEAFCDSVYAMTMELREATRPTMQLYEQGKLGPRAKLMLYCLNQCDTFDEQCSLFLNWANHKESGAENVWLVAVAKQLMMKGRYNPCLIDIWLIWRCLFQYTFVGISRDSAIPNDYYNIYRRMCYKSCLDRLERQPDDVFAMNCAAALGGRSNLSRYSGNGHMNVCLSEMFTILSERYAIDVVEEKEENGEK